jgi:kynurenine formamidase
MRIIDLSHSVHDRMQVFPGDRPPAIKALLNHEDDGCQVSRLQLCVHVGTHMDAPVHFVAGGPSIDIIPCERFVGKGILIDATTVPAGQPIASGLLTRCPADLSSADFAIFRTGWDSRYGTEKYFRHPYLSPEFARLLVEKGVSLVGLDTMSVDRTIAENETTTGDPRQYPVHDILLGNGVLIVENLCRLDQVGDLDGVYAFLPLKLKGGDGSPVRAVFMTSG